MISMDVALDDLVPLKDRRGALSLIHGFYAGGAALAIAEGVHREILSRPRLGSLPAAPDYVIGITNVRGGMLPVYCLNTYLGIKPALEQTPVASHSGCLMVVGSGDHQAVIRMQAEPSPLKYYVKMSDRDIVGLPERLRLHVSSSIQAEDKVWQVVEFKSLFKAMAEN